MMRAQILIFLVFNIGTWVGMWIENGGYSSRDAGLIMGGVMLIMQLVYVIAPMRRRE